MKKFALSLVLLTAGALTLIAVLRDTATSRELYRKEALRVAANASEIIKPSEQDSAARKDASRILPRF